MAQARPFALADAGMFCRPNHNEKLRSRETVFANSDSSQDSKKRNRPIPSKEGMVRDQRAGGQASKFPLLKKRRVVLPGRIYPLSKLLPEFFLADFFSTSLEKAGRSFPF